MDSPTHRSRFNVQWFGSPFLYHLLNIKSGYAKKHSHHEEAPEAILTLLQLPLIGRTYL